ncbi:MAG: hypothetical protein JNL51_02365, partial [Chitinophagaceae bacterium]|nr:hypothetical protein [Chitinophagaceae bacterium]
MTSIYRLLFAVIFFFSGLHLFAQVPLDYYLPQKVNYDPKVPTPAQYLGFQIGQQHVSHDQIVAYMKELARTSNRIRLEEYARTYENRPCLLL